MFLNEALDLHHLYELSVINTEAEKIISERIGNLALLHRDCHKVLHSNSCPEQIKNKLLKVF